MKKSIMFISLLLLVYLLPVNTFGDEGKYQAIAMEGGESGSVFILDTEKGHMWYLHSYGRRVVYYGQIPTKLEIGKRYQRRPGKGWEEFKKP